MNEVLLEKYLNLIVRVGLNVKKGQPVVINTNIENYKIATRCAEVCYKAGSAKVYIEYSNDLLNRLEYNNIDIENLKEVPEYEIMKAHYLIDKNVCKLSLKSPDPHALDGVDPLKIKEKSKAYNKALRFYRDYTMNDLSQWCVASIPSLSWAKTVFPNLSDEDAIEALWDEIFKASRISLNTDPVLEWNKHIKNIKDHANWLNSLNIKTLHFENALGTNLYITLADDFCFAGAEEPTVDGHQFVPNIPTEETFSMPHKYKVNGHVYSTKPLNYNGKIIDKFHLEFKDGHVINFDALKGKEDLEALLQTDEGSSYLGEVALVPYDSPISKSNILFYNTLFDENASCHLALGNAYSMNIINGVNMSIDELKKRGYNESAVHVDFMFGDSTMRVTGIKENGEMVSIFENGNFVK
jgi:aminopeptidase